MKEDDYIFWEDSWNEEDRDYDEDEGECRSVGIDEVKSKAKEILYSILNKGTKNNTTNETSN